MPLIYPTFEELSAQIRAEFINQLPDIDPTVFGSWALSFANGTAVSAQSIVFLVRDLEKQLFPQTATGEYLDNWGDYENLPRKESSPASGLITVTGTAGTVIPILTDFIGSNGITYKSQYVSTIVNMVAPISNLERNGTTVKATVLFGHALATGVRVTIAGVDQPEYNNTFLITVIDALTFSFQLSTTNDPTGTNITYEINSTSVLIESDDTGLNTNLNAGSQLTFSAPGADSPAYVQYDRIAGGSDIETDEEYRERIILSRSIISGVFTPGQVRLAALSVAGNTRAYVKTPQYSTCGTGSTSPAPGQTSVFILRDNDPNILPTPIIIAVTKQAIIDNGALPANMYEDDLFVQGPDLVEIDFIFNSISPDTPTMRTAVRNSVIAFFEDIVDFETDVLQSAYWSAIQETQDLQTGDTLISFSLSEPIGDIVIGPGELATYGEITF